MPFHLNKETLGLGGRKRGSKNRRTIEMETAQKILQQGVFQNLKPMMIAQIQAARGEQYVYRVDRDGEGKETHVLMTDGHEIGKALDAISAGDFDENYYYISTKPASTQAFKELLDRGFGKAKEFKEVRVSGEVTFKTIAQRALERRTPSKRVIDIKPPKLGT